MKRFLLLFLVPLFLGVLQIGCDDTDGDVPVTDLSSLDLKSHD